MNERTHCKECRDGHHGACDGSMYNEASDVFEVCGCADADRNGEHTAGGGHDASHANGRYIWGDALVVPTVCACGHGDVEHHGVDRDPVNGGCFAEGSGMVTPKCPCTLTCTDVRNSVTPAYDGLEEFTRPAEPEASAPTGGLLDLLTEVAS